MSSAKQAPCYRFRRDERGAAGVLAVFSIMAMVSAAALAVDMGMIYRAKISLQASTDAAALAGARNIYNGNAVATATEYGAAAGRRNASVQFTASMQTGYPMLKCLTSIGIACGGPNNANAIVVKQRADVPLYFAKVFGIASSRVVATSTAAASGGSTIPLDMMIVLDATGSMNGADPNCPVANSSRADCALAGVRALLSGLWPCRPNPSGCGTVTNGNVANPVNRVGLMVFPGIANASQAALSYDCSSGTRPTVARYSASPVYQILPLTSDYKSSATATSLSTGSSLVRAARGGGSGCSAGLAIVGGVGTFYADVITAAQAALTANGRPGVQKVIILLSDGDATAASSNVPQGKANNQCRQAMAAAQSATAAGTWVYAIAYGAAASAANSCTTDSPSVSACAALQQVASSSSRFFSSGGACSSNSNSVSDLISIFKNIGSDFSMTRLLPDNAT